MAAKRLRRTSARWVLVTMIGACLVPAAVGSSRADAAGPIELAIGDVSIAEGNGGYQIAHIPVVLSASAAIDVTATYALVGDDAQLSSDWLPSGAATSGTVRIRARAVATTLKVRVLGDPGPETDESLHATLSNIAGADLATDDTGSVTILDDDTAPATGVSVGDVVVPEGDSKARATKVPITLSAPAATDVTVTLTRGGTAAAGFDDKAMPSKSITIRAGRSSALLTVPVLGDVLREPDETVELQASSALPVARHGSVTIRDDASDAGPTVPGTPPFGVYVPPVIGKGAPGELVWSVERTTTALYTEHLMLYRSTGQRGKPIFVSGRVFVPTAPAPPGGHDVVAWAEGTTGLIDECAPSLIGPGVPALGELLTNGYVVVSTDFEGLGTPGPHAYNQGRSEAQTILDSIRAVADFGIATTGRAVLYGGSRGGHAVVATAERLGYAPELQVLGAIGLGAGVVPSHDTLSIINTNLSSPYKGFLMMGARALQQVYGPGNTSVKSFLNHYLTPTGITQLPNADGCNFPVLPHFANIAGSSLFNIVRPPIPPDASTLRQEITVGAIGNRIPIVLMSGTVDPIVLPSAIDDWHAWACAQPGRTAPIEKQWYSAGHFPTPVTEIANWVDDRFQGVPAAESCP